MMINLFKIKLNQLILKQLRISLVAFLFMSSFFACASSTSNSSKIDSEQASLTNSNGSALFILENMQAALLHSDYQIYFVVEESTDDSMTLRYRYLNDIDGNYAQLLYLESSMKEIILHDNIVSYFQPDSVSFSFPAKRIIEAFPDFIYMDFNELNEYYDFILLGKARTANRSSKLIRIIPKDKDRYNYVVWIDEQSSLPLRIDLLDLESNIIHQMKVLSLDEHFDKKEFKADLDSRNYPILLPINKEPAEFDSWQLDWIPKGFQEKAAYNVNFEQSNIDTRLFSDGIFSFSVNISNALPSEKSTHVVNQGIKTIYSTSNNNMNIVIIGNLPLETIERIAQSIKSN